MILFHQSFILGILIGFWKSASGCPSFLLSSFGCFCFEQTDGLHIQCGSTISSNDEEVNYEEGCNPGHQHQMKCITGRNNSWDLSFLSKILENIYSPIAMLELSCGNIKEIPDNYFSRFMRNITGLKLRMNSLENLTINAFTGLENSLSEIDLSYNNLTSMVAFKNLKKLNSLTLDFNGISLIGDNIIGSKLTLQRLSLEGNNLSSLEGISNLNVLNHLNVEFNKINDFNHLEYLTSLETLYLGGNPTKPQHISFLKLLTNLTHLHLPFTNFSTLNGSMFGELFKLEHLTLDCNHIDVIPPNTFQMLTNLKSLFLNGNKLTELNKEMFEGLSQLILLDLSNNKIEEIFADAFKNTPNLETLNLANNQISHIAPGVLSPLTNLKKLFLQYNKLTKINYGMLQDLSNLETLILIGNEIGTIQEKAFKTNPKLKQIEMRK